MPWVQGGSARRRPYHVGNLRIQLLEEARALLEAVLGLTRHLPLDLTAEGIENTAQLTALRDLGCPLGQGHGLSHPLTAPDFRALLHTLPPSGGQAGAAASCFRF